MNQLSHGQRINFPTSVVRSVSFQKVRQGSLSSRTSKQQQSQSHQSHAQQNVNLNQRTEKLITQESSGLCQRLLNKKLLTKQCLNRKPLDSKNVQNNVNPTIIPKTELIKKQLQEKQMKQCTFKPKINKTTIPHRTLQEFVDQQMAYEKFKSDKVNQMREMIRAKIDKENTFQPNLAEVGSKEMGKRGAGQVHERLYEEWSKKRATADNIIAESVEKRPQSKTSTIRQKLTTYSLQVSHGKKCITQARNDPSEFNSEVSKTLTVAHQSGGNETNRHRSQLTSREKTSRQNSQKGLKITKYMDVQQVCEKKFGQKHQKNVQQKQQKRPNPKNTQLYIKKTLREIGNILSELSINEPNLTYLQMSLILQKMNFLDEQTNLNDRKYSFQIWQMLQGDVYESCPLANLVRIVFALLGCHDFGVIEECLGVVMPEGCASRRLVLTEKESKNIKVNFQELSLNRLRKGEYIAVEPRAQPYSFKPFVSKNSTQMAQKYRKRVIQQSQTLLNQNLIEFDLAQNGQVDHVDLLMLDEKCKELKMKMRRQEQEREKIRLEDEAMLGDRKARKKQLRIGVENGQPGYQSRNQYLYELGKNNIRNKKQKSSTHTDHQLSKQCTFHPNLNHNQSQSHLNNNNNINTYRTSSKANSSHHNSQSHHTQSIDGPSKQSHLQSQPQDQIKDFDKSIFRMYEARRLRQQTHSVSHGASRSVTDRSLLSEAQYRSTSNHSHQQQDPFLYLNVCMEGSEDIKVPVFQSDTMKTITHKVKVLMGLEGAEEGKLEEILKQQILPCLREIGMDLGGE